MVAECFSPMMANVSDIPVGLRELKFIKTRFHLMWIFGKKFIYLSHYINFITYNPFRTNLIIPLMI